MSDQDRSTHLEQHTRELFDERVAHLDARTRSRLNQARHAALAAAENQASRPMQRWLLPVGSAAALALIAVAGVQMLRPNVDPATQTVALATNVDDLELMTSDDALDMFQDMDFYVWLDSQDLETTDGAS